MVTATLDAPAAAGLERIQGDPAAFMAEWLGADLWDKQIEIAESVRDHRRTAVKSCHGSGKSYLAARIVIWFLHAYPGSIVLTTAPTFNQVKNILWRNVGAAYAGKRKPLLGRCLQTGVDIEPDWYALGFKAEDTASDRFQGFHAERALVVIDEAAGVDDRVYEALDAVMTSEQARMLLIGNPTNPAGTFYDAFHGSRSLYHTITIAASDTPNMRAGETVRPYLITQQWIDDAITKHGADSPYVQSRVKADFPELSDNTLIPLAWIEAANERQSDEPSGPWRAGVDVARMGSDQSAICIRQGNRVVYETFWSGMDTMQTVGRVRAILADFPPMERIKVDVIGIGAGVADRLTEENYPVDPVNVAEQANDPEAFASLRHELWWTLRERFQEGRIEGPIDDVTMGQLSSVRYKYDSKHTRPVIESKEDAKKRGVRSPDRAEALMLAFAPDRAPVVDDRYVYDDPVAISPY
jgi:phage terminase large subunit